MKKPKPHRPWLTPSGVEIPTRELREICKSWDQATWEQYLDWYESARKEALVSPNIYAKRGEEITETVFESHGHQSCPAKQAQCDQLLSELPPHEAEVLRGTYLRGETQYEIGAIINRSQQSVARIKNNATRKLKWGHRGEQRVARRFMKGESFSVPAKLWDQKLGVALKEQRAYDPANHREEILGHKFEALAIAARSLSEKSIRALYLRYWCDFSISAIARELSIGVNTAELLIEASVSKLKRKIVEIKSLEGGAKCS